MNTNVKSFVTVLFTLAVSNFVYPSDHTKEAKDSQQEELNYEQQHKTVFNVLDLNKDNNVKTERFRDVLLNLRKAAKKAGPYEKAKFNRSFVNLKATAKTDTLVDLINKLENNEFKTEEYKFE